MLRYKIITTLLIVYCCYAAVAIGRQFYVERAVEAPVAAQSVSKAKGDPTARLWLVEYLDYQCGSCREASKMLNSFFNRFPHLVYLQVRFFPLTPHPHGFRSAQYAECAARQDKFWAFNDLVFERQAEWSPLPDIEATFHEYARNVGLDEGKLDKCLENPDVKKYIEDEKADGKKLGVDGTPAFFLNGQFYVGRKAIEEALGSAVTSEEARLP